MNEPIRQAFGRIEELLTKSPERGRQTASSETTLDDGLTCEVREGPWHLVADMPDHAGGSGSGPTPGVFGRAALGSCMAIGYKLWASKLGVPVGRIRVAVETDFDSGALFGTSDAPAGYTEVRCRVEIESSASRAEVGRLVERADRHSPYLDVFTRGQRIVTELHVTSAAGTHAGGPDRED